MSPRGKKKIAQHIPQQEYSSMRFPCLQTGQFPVGVGPAWTTIT